MVGGRHLQASPPRLRRIGQGRLGARGQRSFMQTRASSESPSLVLDKKECSWHSRVEHAEIGQCVDSTCRSLAIFIPAGCRLRAAVSVSKRPRVVLVLCMCARKRYAGKGVVYDPQTVGYGYLEGDSSHQALLCM